MNNIIVSVSKETRYVTLPKSFIGNDSENLQEKMIFEFTDEFVEGQARLEYSIDDEKYYTMLERVDNTYQISLKSVILVANVVNMQLVITEGINEEDIPVFKSNKFYVTVGESINAEIEQPDEYSQWIEIANIKLNQVDKAIEEASNLDIEVSKEGNVSTLEITKKNGTKKSVEILDGQGGGDGTSDYNQLTNKPKINGIELENDKTLEELGYTPYDDSEVQREISNINSALKNKANKSEIPDVSNFITKSVNDLENYLKSSETYTKDQVNELIGNVSTIKIDVVDELPETGETNIIYFVLNDESTENNIYNEYVYINGKPELIGNTNIDLSPYALKTEFDNYYTKDEVENTIADGIEKNIGKEVQLDFNAILEDNKIIATLDESISDYELQNSTGYLFHIYLPLVTLTGDLDNTYPIYLKDKDGNDININSMFQKDINETSTVGDLCQIQDYDTGVGYSWEFYGHYRKISDNGNVVNVVYTDSIVRETNPSMTGEQLHLSIVDNKLKIGTSVMCISDYENNGTSYTKGHTYLIENDSDTEDVILIATDITTGVEEIKELRADLGANFNEVTEDLSYLLSNNFDGSYYRGSVGDTATKVSSNSFTCFEVPVKEGYSYSFKFIHGSVSDIRYIFFVDENDVISEIPYDEDYTSIGFDEKTYVIPEGIKKIYINAYISISNFRKNPREYITFKVNYKEVAKEYIDEIRSKCGMFKSLDLSEHLLATNGFNAYEEGLEDGMYQIIGRGYLALDEPLESYPGDLLLSADNGETLVIYNSVYGGGYYNYSKSSESYLGGYYCNLEDVQYEIEQATKENVSVSNSKLTRLTVTDNSDYRELYETGSTAITLTPSSSIKNLSTDSIAKWSLLFKTNAETECTFKWNDTTSTVHYILNSSQVDKFTPELNTWYYIKAEWKGLFWIFNITSIKEASE